MLYSGYSLARCLKGYLCHVLSSKQRLPKYQRAEEYSNSINCCIFPWGISKNAQTLLCLAVCETWKWEARLLPYTVTCYCPERPVPPPGWWNQGWQQQRNTSTSPEERSTCTGPEWKQESRWSLAGSVGWEEEGTNYKCSMCERKDKRHPTWKNSNRQLGNTS